MTTITPASMESRQLVKKSVECRIRKVFLAGMSSHQIGADSRGLNPFQRYTFFFNSSDVRQIFEKHIYKIHLRSQGNGKQDCVCHETQGQPC